MNTIWLKIAGVAVVAVVVLIVGSKFMGGDSSKPKTSDQAEKPKTFYDMAERDRQLAKPPTPGPAPETETAQPPKPVESPAEQPVEQTSKPTVQTPAPATRRFVLPSDIIKPTTLYFKPLNETDDLAAQELMPYATTGRSLGRLPFLQYGLMVKACRQAEERWPESWYAFRAKQLLEEIRERYAAQYHITEQELDISKYLKPRQGTQPFTVEPVK